VDTKVQRIQITRADYEMRFGNRPDEMALGAILYIGPDDNPQPYMEFVFMSTKQEVATLERLYSLG